MDKWTTLGEKKAKKEKGPELALASAKEKGPALALASADKKGPAPAKKAALDTKGLNGSNLLTKGVSAAAQLINMCNADASESTNENSSEAESEAESESDEVNILFGGSTKNKLLKGRCFI